MQDGLLSYLLKGDSLYSDESLDVAVGEGMGMQKYEGCCKECHLINQNKSLR